METAETPVLARVQGPEALPLQVGLYETAFGKADGDQVLPWRYAASPHGPSITLLTRAPGGEPVGAYACNARRVAAAGQDAAVVGETGDVMTHPDHRGKGLFLDLDRRAMQEAAGEGWPCVIGLPNSKSADIFTTKLGWEAVGSIRPWTFVFGAGADARRERRRAGRLASVAVPWTAWRGSMRRGALRKRFFGKINAVAIPRFDAKADELFAQVRERWPWIQERSAAFLNWRFVEAPSQRFRAHGVYAPDGSLRGYAVVQLPERGEAVGWVVDLLAADDVAFAGAMEAALGHLQKVGAAVARATAVEGSWWERELRASGFRAPASDDRKRIIAHVLDEQHPLASAVRRPSDWYFTDADRDDEVCS